MINIRKGGNVSHTSGKGTSAIQEGCFHKEAAKSLQYLIEKCHQKYCEPEQEGKEYPISAEEVRKLTAQCQRHTWKPEAMTPEGILKEFIDQFGSVTVVDLTRFGFNPQILRRTAKRLNLKSEVGKRVIGQFHVVTYSYK